MIIVFRCALGTICHVGCRLCGLTPARRARRSQVARKLAMVEADLERAEERAETGES